MLTFLWSIRVGAGDAGTAAKLLPGAEAAKNYFLSIMSKVFNAINRNKKCFKHM
jgi:hypothetical protein